MAAKISRLFPSSRTFDRNEEFFRRRETRARAFR
jgi:hypothetical protein